MAKGLLNRTHVISIFSRIIFFPIAFSITVSSASLRALKKPQKSLRERVSGEIRCEKSLLSISVLSIPNSFCIFNKYSDGSCLPIFWFVNLERAVLLTILLKIFGSMILIFTPCFRKYMVNVNVMVKQYLPINRNTRAKVEAFIGYKQCVNALIYST